MKENMKMAYESPKIRVKEIKEENELMAAVSGTITIGDSDDGTTPMDSKRNFFSSDEEGGSSINWDDEE